MSDHPRVEVRRNGSLLLVSYPDAKRLEELQARAEREGAEVVVIERRVGGNRNPATEQQYAGNARVHARGSGARRHRTVRGWRTADGTEVRIEVGGVG